MLQIFFGRTDSQHGDELWSTDGTSAGTHLVADLAPGNQDTRPFELTPLEHTLVFTVQNSGLEGDGELWKSDGTAGGTGLIGDIIQGGNRLNPTSMTSFDNEVVFYGANPIPGFPGSVQGDALWASDGTANGTIVIKSFTTTTSANFSPLYNIGSSLLFFADDGEHGRELWLTDGTAAGTSLVADLVPGFQSSITSGNAFAGVVNGALWFDATTTPGDAPDIWKSDGTAAGTVKVASHSTIFGPTSNGGAAADFTEMNGTAYFLAGSNEIWRSDGTESGTVRVTDNGVAFATEPLLAINGTLFFAAGLSASNLGLELWKSDGTPHSMTLVKDINPAGSSSPHSFVAVGNELYFLASTYNDSGFLQMNLWKSDGTEGGTQQVTSFDATIENLTNANGTLYFNAQFYNESNEGLWKIDGTSGQAVKIADNVDPNTGIVPMDVVPATPTHFSILDTTTGQPLTDTSGPYSGPVSGLQYQYIYAGNDGLNVSPEVANSFIHTGNGIDAIDVSHVGGTNVLDGGTNSNFLVGGTGAGSFDTFFVDDRFPPSDIWSTVANFHAGDAATIFGITPNGFDTSWVDGQGAAGFTGLTLHVTAPGVPTASITLSGYTTVDLTNGKLTTMYGTEADGTPYFYIQGNSLTSTASATADNLGSTDTAWLIPH